MQNTLANILCIHNPQQANAFQCCSEQDSQVKSRSYPFHTNLLFLLDTRCFILFAIGFTIQQFKSSKLRGTRKGSFEPFPLVSTCCADLVYRLLSNRALSRLPLSPYLFQYKTFSSNSTIFPRKCSPRSALPIFNFQIRISRAHVRFLGR